LLTNIGQDSIKLRGCKRHDHRHPPLMREGAQGKPDGGGDVSGDGSRIRPRAWCSLYAYLQAARPKDFGEGGQAGLATCRTLRRPW
jgi:hypothetical protein